MYDCGEWYLGVIMSILCALCYLTSVQKQKHDLTMVGEMVQNSQSLYSFSFSALIDIHEYIYSPSTTEFTFKKYSYSHLPECVFLIHDYMNINFAHIYEMSSFTFSMLYPFTFMIEIFNQHFLCTTFAHHSVLA